MAKKFWAVNRETGERWAPTPGKKEYLVMYDSGYLAVVQEGFYQFISPLDSHTWKVEYKEKK